MASSTGQMVEIKDVSKHFGNVKAVNSVDLSVDRGDFLTIVGPSGCGKTTLLRMTAGFEIPTSGQILINGEHVEQVPAYQRSIGMVFQKLALFPHMTAEQNVAYPLKMRRFDPKDIPDRVHEYLSLVKLGDLAKRRPHELSGGQQQRVAIARALSFSPDLLLLDEPLSALDKKLREEMQLEFRRIQQDLGVTTINVTHDQREALVMSDQIVVMNDGVLQQSASPVDLYREPQNKFVANFIGMTTLLKGTVDKVEKGTLRLKIGNATVTARSNGEAVSKGDTVDCAIRAEQLRIAADKHLKLDCVHSGIVRQRIFEGDRILYIVEVEELGNAILHLFDHDPISHKEYPVDQRVSIGWNTRDLFAFPTS